MIEVKVPRLGRTAEEGTIVNYAVKAGGKIEKGDVLFELEVDKATVEVESPADGFVKFIFAEVGQTLAVGETILILGDKNEKIPQNLVDSLISAASARSSKAGKPKSGAVQSAEISEDKLQISGGNIMPLSRLQKITGQKMLQSKREIPCFYLTIRADLSGLAELRAKLNSLLLIQFLVLPFPDF